MYNGLLHTHNFLRWVILILLLVALFRALSAGKNKAFTAGDRKISLFLMISCDIMLLIGLYQYFSGPLGLKAIQANGMGVVMKDSASRFWAVEHALMMIVAIILVHVGRAYTKKNIPDAAKFKRILVFYGLALLLILVSIPWPFREAIGRPWFPGM
jgi:amino acid permease